MELEAALGRPVVLSNGQLFVGLDEHGLVHDFYFPYVGLDNLTTARSSQHKIGVWVDGLFSWTDDGSWQITVDFDQKSLVSNIHMESAKLGVRLEFEDFVDCETNAFVRCISVTNQRDQERDIRLFMHQVFEISRDGRADTALFVPDDHYLLNYKGRCCLLIAGKIGEEGGFDQYAVGNYQIEGKAGTFKDAEDGELSNNGVEHGGVDSVIRFRNVTPANDSFDVSYWVVAANSQTDAQVIHTYLKYYSIPERLEHCRKDWQKWLSPSMLKLDNVPAEDRAMVQKSLLIARAHCDKSGSVLASGDSSIFNYGRDYYCYCWPRDAAYVLMPMIRLGIYGEAKRFFKFAQRSMHKDGYLMHKYQPDGAIGSTWHPLVQDGSKELAIQEDETASVIFALGQYYHYSGDMALVESMYEPFIKPCADFMSHYIDEATGLPHASYDLWEEKFLTTTYTVTSVIAALETAAELAKAMDRQEDAAQWKAIAEKIRGNLSALYHPDGYYRKGFLLQPDGSLRFDDTVDISSLYGIFMYSGLDYDDHTLTSTLKHVEEKILNTSPVGGVLRYEHDNYFRLKPDYKGNPWIVSSLWLAQVYMLRGQKEDAGKLLEWAKARALPSHALSEQFDPENGEIMGVTPLVWSHAEYINTVLDIYK